MQEGRNHSKSVIRSEQRKVQLFSFIFILLIFSGCITGIERKQISQPNVLLVLTDDQGWGDLGFHGNDSIFTPNLDAFASQATRFNHFFVSSVCAPTRASLLTGRYHLRTGTSWVTHRKEVMRSNEITLAEIFLEAGYATGCFGKWHNGEQYPNNPQGQGFEEFFGFTAGHWNNYFDTHLYHNDQIVKTSGYITDVISDKAIQFIRKNQSKPFFCYIPYNAPHSPFQLPDKYFNKYSNLGLTDKNASIYGMVENIDDNFGRIINTLDSLELRDNTIIIFLTDNGPNGHRFNGGMKGIKAHVDEGGVRVPFFIQWPEKLEVNVDIPNIAAHIDLLPTLAELCNIELNKDLNLDGQSLVPLLMGESDSLDSRYIFTIHTEGQMRIRPASVRTDSLRMVVDYDGNKSLYDMHNDPGQIVDIAEKQPEILNQLYDTLTSWFNEVTELGITPPPVQIGFPESPATFLPAPEAKISTGLKFMGGRGWANDYIINWTKKGDQVTWPVEIQSTGEYEIIFHYDCSPDFVGTAFQVESNGIKDTVTINISDDHPFLPSPDRVKRGEVYEKNWSKSSAGKLTLTKVKGTVSVFLIVHPPVNARFELKGMEIKKSP